MLARVRDRLSYANVVATLALFIALGGSAYAVGEITSRDIKNRTIKGGDVRLNTITGKEIRESRLGRVPSAESAATADISKSADTATTAGSAGVADVARDAQGLAGQGVAAFEKSSRISFGKASPADPADAAGEKVVLAWPELGVELRTAADQPGCGAGELRLGVRNTKSSGPLAFIFEQGGESAVANAAAGVTVRPCVQIGTGQVTDDTGRTLFFDCRVFVNEMRCLGVRSEP